MTDLLREAIADAKAVREVALANAKLALEEAFTPRIQSMLASKLSEEAEEEESMEEGEDAEASHEETTDEGYFFEGEEEGAEETTDEGYFFEGEDEGAEETTDESYFFEGEDEEAAPEETTDESYFFEGEDEAPAEEPTTEGEDSEESMDEDLMEIIRQLEEDIDSSDIGTGDNKKPSTKASSTSTQMKKEKLVQMVEGEEEAEQTDEGEEEVDIQEILRALREGDDEEPVEEGEEGGEEAPAEEPAAQTEARLRESYAVIQFLRSKLNEVNLLNSKLLFSNKLFRSHSLTESQKIKVIENFDRATSLREVKLVYATIAESLKTQKTKVNTIKESYSRVASKPVASTRPKQILSEGDTMANRLRKLAGITR